MTPLGARGPDRERSRVGQRSEADTVRRDRTNGTARVVGKADRLAELHQGLVEGPRLVRHDRRAEEPIESRRRSGARQGLPLGREARRHPANVGVHGDDRLAKGHAGNSGGDVGTHAGQLGPLLPGARPTALAGTDDHPRGLPKSPGPSVVPRSRPYPEDLLLGCGRERLDRGKPTDEPLEVGTRLVDPRLL